MRSLMKVVAAIAALLLSSMAGSAFAQVPAGDTCATAGVITTNGLYPFSTTGASADDPCFFGSPGPPTVWFRFTAPANGTVNADLCASIFDTYLTVLAGSTCPVSCVISDIVAEDDDSCGTASAVSFPVTEGTTYHFVISGDGSEDFGVGVLNFEFIIAGDTCRFAIEVTSGSTTPFDLTPMSAGDDPCDGPDYRTLWFRYTATADGVVTADTCGSSFNTNLQAFIANGCPVICRNRVAQNSNACGQQSLVSFDMNQGQTAIFVVGGSSPLSTGPGVFNLRFIPANGDFNNDSTLNVADVTEFARLLDSGVELPLSVTDFNNDGVVNDLDVQALAEMIVND